MPKIIGNTTATPNPQPNWDQADPAKADYIKNKPKVLTEDDVKILVDEFGSDVQVQVDWAQVDETKVDYIKNKPTNLGSFLEASKEDDGKIIEVVDGTYVLSDIASSSVGTYVKTVVEGSLDEIDKIVGSGDVTPTVNESDT